ncbi:hypothetical protein HY486_00445 [Candidatus Woesearchaeota archaeon]|nr:hypothetical protein [Candidatus Woesearchaeota archaeon]
MICECPTCKRSFKRVEDYPKIYVSSFTRIELPELIGGGHRDFHPEKRVRACVNNPLPRAVLKLFKDTGKDQVSHEGILYEKHKGRKQEMVWYESSKDITQAVRNIVSSPPIKASLLALEGFVSKEVAITDIMNLPGVTRRVSTEGYDDLGLLFQPMIWKEDCLESCRVVLCGGWSHSRISHASLSQTLAHMAYEGRLIPPRSRKSSYS